MLQSEEIPAAAYHVIWMEDAMCDIYEDLLAEKEREIEQMEFQIVECQREIRRLLTSRKFKRKKYNRYMEYTYRCRKEIVYSLSF